MSSAAPIPYFMVAMPNKTDERATLLAISNGMTEGSESLAAVYPLDMPGLRVGTLEKLLSASDGLTKIDSGCEATVRKIERQFLEVNSSNEVLTVDNQPIAKYIQEFRWSSAKYQASRPLEDIVSGIANASQKLDDDLKDAVIAYQEKKHALNALQRKKGGNLQVADLNEVLNESVVKPGMFIETEYLKTVVVVCQKAKEADFLATYESFANDAVGYGPIENKEAILGSPVVPRSAVRVSEDKEGYVLYLVTVFKKYIDQFKVACLSNKVIYRPFVYDPNANKVYQESLAALDFENDQAKIHLTRWCKTAYSELFVAWLHIKVIRIFVESVLRYGLPVDFSAVLIKPTKLSNEKKIRGKLDDVFHSLSDSQAFKGLKDEAASKANAEEYFDYVSFTLQPQAL